MSHEGLPRSCRYCAEMVCGDVNWCERKGIAISDRALPRARKCHLWKGSDMAADSFHVWEPRPGREPKECENQTRMEMI